MDPSDKDLELGLEKGVIVNPREEEEDYSKSPNLDAKVKGGFAVSLSSDVSSCGSVVYVEHMQAIPPRTNGNKKDGEENDRLVKEKRKSLGHKKPPKPPKPPRAASLDAADQKLIKEIAELARLKRARIERIKALKKMKDAKGTSNSNNVLASVFTVIFCIIIILQGMSTGGRPTSFQGSPVPAGARAVEGGLISVHLSRKPFANRPNSGSP